MSVTLQTPFNVATGNGASSVYPYQFLLLSATDLAVYIDGGLKTNGADYSVSNVGFSSGGNVTFVVPPANGAAVALVRSMRRERLTDYQQLGDFLTAVVNPDFDRAILLEQDSAVGLGRSIRAPAYEVSAAMELPPKLARAGRLLYFSITTGDVETLTLASVGGISSPLSSSIIATTLNSLKQTAAESAAGVTPVDLAWPPGHVWRYGAVGDGATDDLLAFNKAMSCNQLVYVPPTASGYRIGSGITIPNGVALYSECFMPSSPPAGTRLVVDLSVAVGVTMGAAGLLSAALKGVTITRAAGAIPAGCIGLLVNTGYNITITDVLSDRQAKGVKFYAAAPNGIAAMLTRVYTSGITEDHVVIDGWPEMRWSQGRCGANGANNFACNSYVRYDNTNAGATYPNGDFFENVHFNQGNNPPSYWLDFVTTGASSLEHKFTDCHVENLTAAYIHNSVNAVHIDRLSLKGNTLNTPVPFTSLVPATQINQWELSGNEIAATTWDLSNVNAINGLQVTGNTISGCTATFTSTVTGSKAQNATASFTGNTWFSASAVTLNGEKWSSLLFADSFSSNSTLTINTTTANVSVLSPNKSLGSWTPALNFGGSQVGITYGTQSGAWHITGSMVTYLFKITLTSKGAQVGAATITGFPVSQNGAAFQTGGGGIATASANMAGLAAAPIILNGVVGGAPGVIQLLQQGAAATAALTDANFTNTSSISGQVSFFS